MFTPKQVADSLDLSSTTIRNYSRLWADYLSLSANPQAGQGRLYSEDDIAVISTIVALRENGATTDQIRAALDAGQRLEPMRPLQEETPADDGPTVEARAAADQARAAVNAAETAIAIYRDRVNQLESRADALADRLIEAEKRAAVAEAAAATATADRARADALAGQAAAVEARAAAAERELQILRELHAAADPGRKMTFWEWVQQRRR